MKKALPRNFNLLVAVVLSMTLLVACKPAPGTLPAGIPQELQNPEVQADYEAGEVQPYSEAAYRRAIADGNKVFLDFFAPWCPTCRANAPFIEASFEQDFTDDVVGFKVDYDSESALKKELLVTSQSTYVLLEGGHEIRRMAGYLDEALLRKFFGADAEVTLNQPVETRALVLSYQPGALQSYSQEKYESAIGDGRAVLLDFHADWCTVCVGNAPSIESALENQGEVVGLKINYDTALDLRAMYNVTLQSTLILLHDGKEVARSTGPQSLDSMLELLAG